ncbi:potassium channel family protein [Mycoplasmopsis fermentans]|uniref:potassium channel family protein n=1 Tax=Mycoplasmopsis fermentans TaxID=2115 RepID=UPI0001E3305B|nr:potassium channel family protein [Mycoplasmopsis fermentans]ADN69387.1 putative potassium channel protein [Mycoplasmopsis fermentans JER]
MERETNLIKNKKINDIFEAIGIIVTVDNDLKTNNKKHRITLWIFRTLYLVFIALFVLFGFVSFILLKYSNHKNTFDKAIKFIEISSFFVFVVDWLIHWITYPARDKKSKNIGVSYLKYLITSGNIILILTFLPSLYVINNFLPEANQSNALKAFNGFKFLRILRLIMLLNVFVVFKNISESVSNEKVLFFNIFLFIGILIVLFALTVWYTETEYVNNLVRELPEVKANPTKFESEKIKFYTEHTNIVKNFGDALYFSAITLTTIGYGDYIPYSGFTKMIVPLISMVGIAIIAIPGGMVAASVLTSFQKKKDNKEKANELAEIIDAEIERRVKERIKEEEKEMKHDLLHRFDETIQKEKELKHTNEHASHDHKDHK